MMDDPLGSDSTSTNSNDSARYDAASSSSATSSSGVGAYWESQGYGGSAEASQPKTTLPEPVTVEVSSYSGGTQGVSNQPQIAIDAANATNNLYGTNYAPGDPKIIELMGDGNGGYRSSYGAVTTEVQLPAPPPSRSDLELLYARDGNGEPIGDAVQQAEMAARLNTHSAELQNNYNQEAQAVVDTAYDVYRRPGEAAVQYVAAPPPAPVQYTQTTAQAAPPAQAAATAPTADATAPAAVDVEFAEAETPEPLLDQEATNSMAEGFAELGEALDTSADAAAGSVAGANDDSEEDLSTGGTSQLTEAEILANNSAVDAGLIPEEARISVESAVDLASQDEVKAGDTPVAPVPPRGGGFVELEDYTSSKSHADPLLDFALSPSQVLGGNPLVPNTPVKTESEDSQLAAAQAIASSFNTTMPFAPLGVQGAATGIDTSTQGNPVQEGVILPMSNIDTGRFTFPEIEDYGSDSVSGSMAYSTDTIRQKIDSIYSSGGVPDAIGSTEVIRATQLEELAENAINTSNSDPKYSITPLEFRNIARGHAPETSLNQISALGLTLEDRGSIQEIALKLQNSGLAQVDYEELINAADNLGTGSAGEIADYSYGRIASLALEGVNPDNPDELAETVRILNESIPADGTSASAIAYSLENTVFQGTKVEDLPQVIETVFRNTRLESQPEIAMAAANVYGIDAIYAVGSLDISVSTLNGGVLYNFDPLVSAYFTLIEKGDITSQPELNNLIEGDGNLPSAAAREELFEHTSGFLARKLGEEAPDIRAPENLFTPRIPANQLTVGGAPRSGEEINGLELQAWSDLTGRPAPGSEEYTKVNIEETVHTLPQEWQNYYNYVIADFAEGGGLDPEGNVAGLGRVDGGPDAKELENNPDAYDVKFALHEHNDDFSNQLIVHELAHSIQGKFISDEMLESYRQQIMKSNHEAASYTPSQLREHHAEALALAVVDPDRRSGYEGDYDPTEEDQIYALRNVNAILAEKGFLDMQPLLDTQGDLAAFPTGVAP